MIIDKIKFGEMRMEEKYMKTKKIIITTMCCLICVMAVAYAAFATQLTVNGTASIESTWDIEFTKIQKFSSTGNVTEISAPTASGTTVTFNVDLESPGDEIIYFIYIKNKGTLDAIVNDITAGETGSDAIKFEITGIKKGTKLKSNNETFFAVTIDYDSSITSQPVYVDNKLTLSINFVQDVGQTITDEDITINPSNDITMQFVGDKYTVGSEFKIGDEAFYIISVNGTTSFAALAKYNLDVNTGDVNTTYKGTGKQDSNVVGYKEGVTAYGGVGYGDVQSHLNTYRVYLRRLGANVTNVRYITGSELENLGCVNDASNNYCLNAPSWVYSTSYWIEFTSGTTNLNIRSDGYLDLAGARTPSVGVRPVIEMNYSDIK